MTNGIYSNRMLTTSSKAGKEELKQAVEDLKKGYSLSRDPKVNKCLERAIERLKKFG